jgi:NitT/TauT family transport system ATP-binding protein
MAPGSVTGGNGIALRVENLSIAYVVPRLARRLDAVIRVNFDVATGSFVSLVGPSGCGKTSILNTVAGLLPGFEGRVAVHGREISGPGRDRALVFQQAALLPWRTVLGNVAYGLECHGVGRAEARQRAIEFIELVALRGFEHHYPHELSGGMQQRVNLARALAVEPSLLLMDEPFAALDAQTRETMQGELTRIWSIRRSTVLFITHQIDEAAYLSDRVVVLSARPGRIKAVVDVTLPRPRSLATKRTDRFQEVVRQIWDLIEPGSATAEAPSSRDAAL